MEELWQRFVGDLVGRLDGPLHFRLIVQPLVAVILAALDGFKDAKLGKPAYGWAVFTRGEHRKELLEDGWKHVSKPFIVAIVIDVIYQLKVQHAFYPGEAILTALVLAVLPYLLLRGPVNRLACLFRK